MKETNKGTLLIIVLVILLAGCVGYIVFDILKEKNEQPNKQPNQQQNTEEKEEDQPEKTKITSKLLFSFSCYDKDNEVFEENFEVDGTKHSVKVQCKEKHSFMAPVYIDDKNVGEFVNAGKFYSIGDLVAFVHGGSAKNVTSIKFFNFKGEKVKEVYDMDRGIFELTIVDGSVTFDGDTITIPMTPLAGHSYSLSLINGDGIAFPVSDENKQKYNLTDDTIINVTYQLKYFGNEQFSDMKVLSTETLKEINQ